MSDLEDGTDVGDRTYDGTVEGTMAPPPGVPVDQEGEMMTFTPSPEAKFEADSRAKGETRLIWFTYIFREGYADQEEKGKGKSRLGWFFYRLVCPLLLPRHGDGIHTQKCSWPGPLCVRDSGLFLFGVFIFTSRLLPRVLAGLIS